jgi:hypothetical protein
VYGVPEGNSDAGMMESKTAVILPVAREITMVADVRRPEMTAREEATTAIEGMLAVAMVAWGEWLAGDAGLIQYIFSRS